MTGAILAILALMLGGLLKGATGAGAPIIAVPVMAMFFNVPVAVAVFAMPNLLGNVWQAWSFRAEQLPRRFMIPYAVAGGLGTLFGTFLLANLPGDAMAVAVAVAVFAYVGFRLLKPAWVLAYPLAEKLAPLAGLAGGTLFGATGVGAPVTLSFLNAMKLERRQFVATVTVFFCATALVQIPLLFWYGIMDGRLFLISCAALAPILAMMPVGNWLAKRLSREWFDRIILTMLTLIAVKLLWDALT